MRYLERSADKFLGEIIAEHRKGGGFSQELLSKKLNISQRALSSYERGKRSLPVFLLPKISKLLSIPIEKLLGLENSNSPDGRTSSVRLLRKLEKVEKLSKNDQKLVLSMIDSLSSKLTSVDE